MANSLIKVLRSRNFLGQSGEGGNRDQIIILLILLQGIISNSTYSIHVIFINQIRYFFREYVPRFCLQTIQFWVNFKILDPPIFFFWMPTKKQIPYLFSWNILCVHSIWKTTTPECKIWVLNNSSVSISLFVLSEHRICSTVLGVSEI